MKKLNFSFIISILFVILLIFISIFHSLITPFDPENYFDYNHLSAGPSKLHWFGLDSLGRDIFSRILYGTHITLLTSIISVIIGAIIGSFLGLLTGYYQNNFDILIMRICDILLALPSILLAVIISVIIKNGILNVIFTITIINIPIFIRLVRSNTLIIKNQDFILASQCIGLSNIKIVFYQIFPLIINSIIIYSTMRIGTSIITATSLSFLGLGIQAPTPEWGLMVNESRFEMLTSPHLIIFPSLAIFITVLSFNIISDNIKYFITLNKKY
ncbi:ABC transporter permease subunit [Enterobacteriaceae endosymbiont of Plateumaris consimilis]|uniref:ABC transporter permease subunit n=1 Tax=Enterobacteriaceae endosymbiont of Plateumaris consimilis TaxID=2675794 RepID=UPI0014492CB1|nr:ABC transporter permease subunit [Enterobacteriaceae endosymbiont of Plateumaris consimilis]QJC28444.1 ABC transporter permease subunit [Enterobacteriaceae endosymbiont of Plateumaris consimilis]